MSEVSQEQFEQLRRQHQELKNRVVTQNEQLREQNKELQAENKELHSRIDDLEEQNGQLEKENEELQDRVTDLEDHKEQLQETNEDLGDRVEELEAQPDIDIDPDEKEPLTTLTVEGLPVGRRIAGSISEYDWEAELRPQLEAELRESTESPDRPTTPADELTHIEKISRAAGDDISSVTDSVAARRAVALWRNLPRWGSKTPKGYCLRPKDNPKRLLEADQGEDLAWKQYYRAAEALESLSEGAVTFFDSDKHGKMLVLHEQSEAFDRVRASLTASTAHAEG